MIDYKTLRKACREMELNPNIFGDNPSTNGQPLESFKDPFDFRGINFPKKQLKEVLQIGKIIYNLTSQICKHPYELMTKKGKKEFKRDEKIKKILPVLQEAIQFWLESGLKKCKLGSKKLVIYNGKVFEINPEQLSQIEKMNFYLRIHHYGFLYKEAMSERGG